MSYHSDNIGDFMKKIAVCFMLTMLMIFSVSVSLAEKNPVNQLTGSVWVESSQENKLALIFGVECAISMEYMTEKYQSEQDGDGVQHSDIVDSLTPFSKGWILAFSNVTRQDIVAEIDAWYANNQDKLDTPVFNIIWHEVIDPRLDANK